MVLTLEDKESFLRVRIRRGRKGWMPEEMEGPGIGLRQSTFCTCCS
jgi:hypothetical protein